jgi:translation initiation factor 1
MNKPTRLVYSNDLGRIQPVSEPEPRTPGDGVVRLHRETKGRKGAGVTLITGLDLPPDALKALAKKCKQKASVGGTIKDGTIEIQGDQRDLLLPLLQAEGFTVKKAGG